MKKLITTLAVALVAATGVQADTLAAWVEQGYLPHVCLSEGSRRRCIRFDAEQLEHWVRERTCPGRLDRLPDRPDNPARFGCASGARERR